METGGIAPSVLISSLDGGEWSALRPGRFTPGERILVAITQEAVIQSRSERCGEEKNSFILPGIEPWPSIP
jgi:hypothetical protein